VRCGIASAPNPNLDALSRKSQRRRSSGLELRDSCCCGRALSLECGGHQRLPEGVERKPEYAAERGIALHAPVSAECVAQQSVLAIQTALDQISVEAIPKAKGMRGVFRIEAGDLVDAAFAIARELSLPLGFARVEGTRDFDGYVRSAAFPGFPGGKRAGHGAHAHDQIRRQALPWIRGVPIQELVRPDRTALAHERIGFGART